jgi:paraquat-inducible protein B
MSKANPALIGGFVIGAIALLVIGLLVFGGTSWFKTQNRYVAYFPGSVKGLRVGANVDFRGVTIGQVTQINVNYNPADQQFRIPVVMEFDPARIEIVGDGQAVESRQDIQRLIEAGLRAQLQNESLLTGLLFVNLDFRPKTPVKLIHGDEPYPEIPTIESGLEQIQQSAGDIAQQLPGLLSRLNAILGSIDEGLTASTGDVQQIVASVADIAGRVSEKGPALDQILANANATTGEVRDAAKTVDQILQTNHEAIGSLINEWTVTAVSVRRMADQVNNLIAENRAGLRDFTQSGLYEYTGLAQDAQRMVDEITRVTEELQRDPARFLFGDRAGGVAAQ